MSDSKTLNVDDIQIRELRAQALGYEDEVTAEIAADALDGDRGAYLAAAAIIKGWYTLPMTEDAYTRREISVEGIKIVRDKATRYGHRVVEDVASAALSSGTGAHLAACLIASDTYAQPAKYVRLLHGQS